VSRSVVIFGASGDLARHKLLPALFNRFRAGVLGDDLRVWGTGRTEWADEEFRRVAREDACAACGDLFESESWERFAALLSYRRADYTSEQDLRALDAAVSAASEGPADSRLYYLATVPSLFPALLELLGTAGLAREERGFRRVVIEKPFGQDLASARRLNEVSHGAFREEQIFRIDHYLAKETVQAILAFRFANVLFEPVWNRNFVESVHVFVAEKVGVGDRAGYYEQAGVLRDMFQNHLLQLLALVALDPPARFNADALRNEKLKVLQAIEPPRQEALSVVSARGQYEGYRSEPGVAPDSETATQAVLRLSVDSWRWTGVPFVLESGKCLARKVMTIRFRFRRPPLQLFRGAGAGQAPNTVTFRLQPDEGVHVSFLTKQPGEGMVLRPVDMDFRYDETFAPGSIWNAYERLLVDALQGDASLFMRADEIERAWQVIDPVLHGWQDAAHAPPLELYRRGSWGPPGAERARGGAVTLPTGP
jgi:glucose-6-phosphate 1-dehydrogenase